MWAPEAHEALTLGGFHGPAVLLPSPGAILQLSPMFVLKNPKAGLFPRVPLVQILICGQRKEAQGGGGDHPRSHGSRVMRMGEDPGLPLLGQCPHKN